MREQGALGANKRGARLPAPMELPRRPCPASVGVRLRALILTVGLVVVTLGIGWLIWSVFEWRNGRTASFRLSGLRVVRQSDGRPIGLCRSIVRNAICCTILLVPTIVACALISLAFVMGASPPEGLMRRPRSTPWDVLTRTTVLDERSRPSSTLPLSLDGYRDDVSVNMN